MTIGTFGPSLGTLIHTFRFWMQIRFKTLFCLKIAFVKREGRGFVLIGVRLSRMVRNSVHIPCAILRIGKTLVYALAPSKPSPSIYTQRQDIPRSYLQWLICGWLGILNALIPLEGKQSVSLDRRVSRAFMSPVSQYSYCS